MTDQPRHSVRFIDATDWQCVECGEHFDEWPADSVPCPGVPEDTEQPPDLLYDAWVLLANGAYWDHTSEKDVAAWDAGRVRWRDLWHAHLDRETGNVRLRREPPKVVPFMDAKVGEQADTYKQVNGEQIDEYGWVTELEWFDDRSAQVILRRQRWQLVEEQVVVLPDPYPDEEEDDEPAPD